MILAVDPSITNCGYAVLEGPPIRRIKSGTWSPSKAKAAEDRFDQLARFVWGLLTEHRIDSLVVETPSGGQRHSATQLMVYARAIGVVEGVGRVADVAVERVPVMEWKRNAGKGQTDRIVRYLLNYAPADHNESDALGLGLYWLRCREGRR